jgi:two-component system, sensor histidine kinase and response regulator
VIEPCVLYVDDDAANRIVFEASFKSKFPIETASSGEAALLRMAQVPVAVLFTDQRMPGMAGNELLRKTKEVSAETVGVVLTAYDDVEPILEAMNSGYASRYIIKPWKPAEIESTIRWGLEVYRLGRAKSDLEMKLIESDRFTTLGSIAAGMLHDLRQPLTIISANIDILAERSERDSEPLAMLSDARTALDQVMALVESALRYLATGKRDGSAGDPSLAARYSLKLCAPVVLANGGYLSSTLPDKIPLVGLPTSALTQIMVNLLLNAAQALPPRESLTVEQRRVPAVVELGLAVDGERVRISVRDSGVGMTPEVRARALEPFFTTKPAGVGTGLGLFNTRTLVDEAHGELLLDSRPGEGTTVTVWLPATGEKKG